MKMDNAMSYEQARRQLTARDEPLEIVPATIRDVPSRVFRHAPDSAAELLERAAREFGSLTFLVYEDERYTFAQTRQRAVVIAWILRARFGVQKGDRVAIAMRNYPDWAHAYLAIISLGAIVVAVNAWWTPAELEHSLRESGTAVVFADQERIERILSCSALEGTRIIGVRHTTQRPGRIWSLAELLAASGADTADFPPATIDPDDDISITYTSGSTAMPKGAVATHRSLVNALLSMVLDVRISALRAGKSTVAEPHELQHTLLLPVPFFHVSGSHSGLMLSLYLGRTMVLMYKWDPQKAVRLVMREGITLVTGTAAITNDFALAAAASGIHLPTLQGIGGGGAPRPAQQVRNLQRTFPQASISTGWGMTELNGIGAVIFGADYTDRPDSVGRCSAVLDLKIIDDSGRELAVGEVGEICMRGSTVIRGYWNRPAETAAAFTDHWLHTGDVGRVEPAGLLCIVGRIKDMILRGGENISSPQVEAAICEHPAVAEVAVVGVPDERLGETVAAVIVPRPGERIDTEELKRRLGQSLASFQVPTLIRIQNEPLPRIASGKIAKRQIRDRLIGELGIVDL